MAKDTDVNAVTEALDHLLEVQEQHTEILTHLEQREVPDLAGLTRRLEEVADAVERLNVPEPPQRVSWRLPGVLLLAAVLGWGICWLTARWLPSALLPPGFSRVTPAVPQKGR
jgi:hypothetical protein